MTVLVDTSVWIAVLRDQTGSASAELSAIVEPDEIALTRFNQIELLQGAANEEEWGLLSAYLDTQVYLDTQLDTWRNAARIFFDLRRRGQTIRSTIDCCIAQIAIDHRVLLLHNDRDFEAVAELRPLSQQRWEQAA